MVPAGTKLLQQPFQHQWLRSGGRPDDHLRRFLQSGREGWRKMQAFLLTQCLRQVVPKRPLWQDLHHEFLQLCHEKGVAAPN